MEIPRAFTLNGALNTRYRKIGSDRFCGAPSWAMIACISGSDVSDKNCIVSS